MSLPQITEQKVETQDEWVEGQPVSQIQPSASVSITSDLNIGANLKLFSSRVLTDEDISLFQCGAPINSELNADEWRYANCLSASYTEYFHDKFQNPDFIHNFEIEMPANVLADIRARTPFITPTPSNDPLEEISLDPN